MLYLTIITVNVLNLFLQGFNIESVKKNHFFAFRFTVRTLIWHPKE